MFISKQISPPKPASLCISILVLVVLATALLASVVAAPAGAETLSPQWTVTAVSEPTNFNPAPGSTGTYMVFVRNTGGAASDGGTITVQDILPSGLAVRSGSEASGEDYATSEPKPMTCTGLTCTYSGVVAVDDYLVLKVPVEVLAGAPSSVANLVTVSGGGAAEASRETPTAITSTPATFGIAPGSTATALSSTQAGAHPDLTVSLGFNKIEHGLLAGDPKETVAELPPGFAGDLADTPKCPIGDFSKMEDIFEVQGCSLSSQVGVVALTVDIGSLGGFAGLFLHAIAPVYNLTTNPGEIARLGFIAEAFGVEGTVSLSPGDYGLRTTFQGISEHQAQLTEVSLTVWGVPAAPSHDLMRGRLCKGITIPAFGVGIGGGGGCTYGNTKEVGVEFPNGQASTSPPIPYLTSPTQCTGEPLQATLSAASWEDPSHPETVPSNVGPLTGCSLLEFAPAIAASPDTTRADTPAGLTFGVHMGQEGLVSEFANSQADIEDTTVTLPPGVVINPGQANGLGACQFSQDGVGAEGPPSCPSDSKVGQVEIETPILKNKLDGNVYLLQSNPPDIKLLVAPEDPPDGIYVKFIGDVHLNEATGQLTTTFEKSPQLPFSDLRLSFSGGAQAALATPTGCGTYTTNAAFTPWSGEAEALVTSSFVIETGPGGSACASPLPFSPELIAGATTDQAGGFTNFSMLLRRGDGQQRIDGLRFVAPEGLTGFLSKVPLCTNAQAETNTCPEASKIGHTVIESGPGPYPLVVPEAGQEPAPIYLTEAYDGAPFGLSIVVPLHVGPFVLPTQRVRARIEINPYTSQLTVTTSPLPQIVAGVPTDLRELDAVIERPGFMVNPTNCDAQAFSGTAYGTPPPGTLPGGTQSSGANTEASISSHFQVGACQALKFEPKFTVSTSGKTSKADGASLTTKVTYPSDRSSGIGQQGADADIGYVKIELPKQLPSRLTTLQKACTSAQFEANPAACPSESKIGYATVHTPLLPVPLTGPVIFVSHGGEAFPSLTVVLQGDGVTIDLVGTTFISKAGVTSTTFKTVPDAPFSTFELTLPQGPYSALAANLPEKDHGNLCGQKLTMPTAFTAQNGIEIHQNTPISVTGCPKTKTKAQKLAAALKACHKKHGRKRAQCEKAARRKYGPVKKRKRA